jgi:enoyl-CoA hydratase/carnithine racemase
LTLSLDDAHVGIDEFWTALREVQRAVPGSVRVVVLWGAGPSFSTGVVPSSDTEGRLAALQRACDWTSDPAFISVAALHGRALGAGLEIAMGCDLRVVTTDAVLGPYVGFDGTGRLVETLGYARALELCVTGRRVGGGEAYDLGLAQRSVEPTALDAEVERLVAELLAPVRDVVREVKALLLGARALSSEEQLAAEREATLRLREETLDETSAHPGAPPG